MIHAVKYANISGYERWTESIAQKMKRKKKVDDRSRKEVRGYAWIGTTD
jgi:hypothetical protein